ncbi:odorant receptor 13a-like isoform X2 [Linepithema humile]|uniref:odorant receptor 13a-like isoform X2 n=1 Tax=Linepithema humile TaxID=83485 RepID=UPI00351DCFCD
MENICVQTFVRSINEIIITVQIPAHILYVFNIVKSIFLKKNRFYRTFNNILAMMAADWEQKNSTDFSVTINTATLSHYFSNIIVGFHMLTATLYSIMIVFGANNHKMTKVSERPFILKMDLPFDSDTQFSYGLVLIVQFSYLLITSCALSTLNALLIVLVLHLVGQINILDKWLTEMYSKENGFKPSLTLIRKLIKKHQRIIDFSENIETIYSNIALMLFVSDTLIICCVGFVIVTSIGTPNAVATIIKSLAFYAVINLEAFMFCFAGEYLSVKSKTIGDAAYNSQWYETKFQDSRIILLLIMRSQNQLTITVGKFADLSLERFASFVRGAASYVSVMLAMY